MYQGYREESDLAFACFREKRLKKKQNRDNIALVLFWANGRQNRSTEKVEFWFGRDKGEQKQIREDMGLVCLGGGKEASTN